ncbi:MAG: Nif3-like dinuclear metal center hexameric protein [Anaerolineales bacterium]|nr:Nif3-like dinuclear metal center hexameric protein [Anaerolineales bacterium]
MNIKEVVEQILTSCEIPRLEKTCDQLMAGDWDAEVTGIVTTFMATVDVIKDAVAKGANLIITHEPTYFTGLDQTDWLEGDEVYLLKKKLIDDNQINIWRFHDHMHFRRPDLIYVGLNKELGWADYAIPETMHCYEIPTTKVKELTAFFKEKFEMDVVQIIGEHDAEVKRVGILVGGGSLGLGSEQMPMEVMRNENLDVIVCGEILEWTLCAYVRDASQLGLNKSLIILGHNRTEEAGMKYLPDWLETFLPAELPISFSEAGEPFTYL